MGDVLSFAGLAHAIALHRLGEDDGRLPNILYGGGIGRVHLNRIGAAAAQRPDLVVAPVLHQRGCLGIFAEEMLTHIGAVLGFEILVFAVDAFLHALAQHSRGILGQQRVPVAPPGTLITFHPAPRKTASSSCTILPLPRTGPSRRCKLQLITKMRLSSRSRPASDTAPSDSGSSISPSPMKAHTLRAAVSAMPRPCRYLRKRA